MGDVHEMSERELCEVIAEFDERCEVRAAIWGISACGYWNDAPPPYTTDWALLMPVVEQVQSVSAALDLPHKVDDEWVAFIAPPVCTEDTQPDDIGRLSDSTCIKALARAVAWVAMQKEASE